jgi:hypothetical protein
VRVALALEEAARARDRGWEKLLAMERSFSLARDTEMGEQLRAAESALAEMTKERDEARDEAREMHGFASRMAIAFHVELGAARQEREKLAEALAKFGQHDIGCDIVVHGPGTCSCGFWDVALPALRLSPGAPSPTPPTSPPTEGTCDGFERPHIKSDECVDWVPETPPREEKP